MEYNHLGKQAWRQIKKGHFPAQLSKKQIAYAERFATAAERQGNMTDEAIKALFIEVNRDSLSEAERYYALNVMALCWKYGQAIEDFIIAEVEAGRLKGMTKSGGRLQIWTFNTTTGTLQS